MDMIVDSFDHGFFTDVLDGISDSIKIVDREFNVVYTNKAGAERVGKKPHQMIEDGRKCFDLFHGNEEQCSFCIMNQVLRSGKSVTHSFRAGPAKNSKMKEISAFPLKDGNGDIVFMIEIVRDITDLVGELTHGAQFTDILSADRKMESVFDLMESVAPTNATVLITGETGTGKELISRAIHKASNRKDQSFVAINCGAMTESLLESELFGHEKGAFTGAESRRIGKFELANKGTLFLDEIGTISPSMQIKILRALQEGEINRVGGNDVINVDVRYICATNADLKKEVENGNFREDLYYRINVMPIPVPALRDRGDDVELLAQYYLKKFSKSMRKPVAGFSEQAIRDMHSYRWPGNIRELGNLIERGVILCKGSIIERLDIPVSEMPFPSFDNTASLKDVSSEAERRYLEEVLKTTHGNVGNTAKVAGINTRTVHRKMKEYGLLKESYR